MTILARVYAAAPADEILLPTLEVASEGQASIYTCGGFEDQLVTLETAQQVPFLASALSVSLPPRNNSGQQNLNFAMQNVTGEAQRFVDFAIEAGAPIYVIFRVYLLSDLSAPQEPPLRMVAKTPKFQNGTLQVTASYADIIGMAWPRRRYTAAFAPGLKYMS
ncbi:DUF1833 family protein [Salinicola sp. CPA57]|uniref:DUF1833 family protein n=1 Tax=Salinicola sp. CPA57 TaxID=1949080 RepID=UPI000DA1236A|nr:DUF1833 family protein [Salinicola sp. CPA57]